jgi:hypothetical protein
MTPLKGSKAGATRGTASLILIVLTGLLLFAPSAALFAPSVALADGHLQQWSKARKVRQADLAPHDVAVVPPNKLKWRKARPDAGSPSSGVERAEGGKEPNGPSMILLTNATVPVNGKPIEKSIHDDEPSQKLRLLAVDDDAGELVPIAADDEPEADDMPADDSSEELPAKPKRRPVQPTEIDTDDSPNPPFGDEFAMGPTQPEPRCPTVKDSVQDGGFRPIGEITNKIDPEPGDFPQECPLAGDPYEPRNFATTDFTWKASALCHKPLYFEQPQMERYGHTFGPVIQPIFSGAHFFVSVVLLPYKMGVEPPLECVYALGWYRPGSCAPRTVGPIPLSARGALAELGVGTGLNYLFP